MSSDLDLLEKIDLYQKGGMNIDEKVAFEKEINSSAQLREQIELSNLVDEIIVSNEMLKLKEQMQKDLNKPKSNAGLYVGATIFIVTLGGFWAYTNFSTKYHNVKVEMPTQTFENINKINLDTNKIVSEVVTNNKKQDVLNELTKAKNQNSSSKESVVANNEVDSNIKPQSYSSQPITETKISELPKVENKIKNHQQITKPVDLCQTLSSNVQFSTISSCKGQATGELLINIGTVKGGTPPYTFQIEEQTTDFKFDNLATGNYDLLIKDAGNCIVKNSTRVFIGEKNCKVSKEFTFNPTYEHSWSIPYNTEKNPTSLKIFDKSGKVYYQTNVSSFEPSEWNGQSNNGMNLNLDLYFYIIEYNDNTFDEGSINISK